MIRYAAYGHIRSHDYANINEKAEASFGELTPEGLEPHIHIPVLPTLIWSLPRKPERQCTGSEI